MDSSYFGKPKVATQGTSRGYKEGTKRGQTEESLEVEGRCAYIRL